QLDAQSTHGIIDDLSFVSAKENQISVLSTRTRNEFGQGLFMDVFDDGRLQAPWNIISLVHANVGQPLSAIHPYKLGVRINLAACELAAIRYAHGNYAAACIIGWAGKDLELHIAHQVIHIGQFERNT